MTTTTVPDVDLTADLRLWLKGEIEKPCELWIDGKIACPNVANWLMYGHNTCDHEPRTFSRLTCDQHQKMAALGLVRNSTACDAPVEVTWIERIRRRRRWWSR